MKTITQDEKAVQQLHDDVITALNNMDTERLLSLHADNIVLMEPNMATIMGKQQMSEMFEKFKKQEMVFSFSYSIDEMEIFGNRALVRGHVIKTTFKNHWNRIHETLKFLTFSEKQPGGDWLRTHVMVNSNMPLEQKPAAPRLRRSMGFRDKLWKN